MKTIKQEEYKGYGIEVRVEYREDTTTWMTMPEKDCDSIKISIYTSKSQPHCLMFYIGKPDRVETVEFRKTEKESAYHLLNKKVEQMIDKAKKDIDKLTREKEMTNGLPESLLEGEGMRLFAESVKESGEIIGNTLKSVLARISDVPSVKERLEKYGINTDGSVEMTLKDLASKWSSLDDEQKKLVGVDVAGVYRLSGFIMALSELNKHKE